MKLNQGIRLIAIGFLFTIINLNITTTSNTINVTPDFIGWLLIAAGLTKMKEYTRRKPYYLGGAVLLTLITIALWLTAIIFPKFDLRYYEVGASLITGLYIFILLGLLAKIAKDHGSRHAHNLRVLRYAYLIVYILFQAIELTAIYLPLNVLSIITLIAGTAALVIAVATAIVLFKLSFDLEKEEE
ncbi:MAG: hypothetical protein IJI46_06000 [Erysipelotrichaceae bacterium]|nr:hypothetical protein [Erysipelotrichaceae bacterium]